MAYATLAKLRVLTHFTVAEISDADVTALIAEADRGIVKLATIESYNEKLSGDIDSSNVLFTTKNKPIADTNFDSSVDEDDVTVYLLSYDTEMNKKSTETTVSSVNARDGIITLTTAPTTSNAEAGVYADYRYYNNPVDYDILKLAASYYLGHLCEMKIRAKRIDYTLTEQIPDIQLKSRWMQLVYDSLPFAKPGLRAI